MFLPIPFRAKYKLERLPYVTLGLIAANVLIYAFTSRGFLEIKDGVVEDFGLSLRHFSAVRLLVSMFLHGGLEHIFFNMVALWLFGSAVEGRLGHLKYAFLYLAAGVVGSMAQTFTLGLLSPETPCIGASGAIMGLMGSYLYIFPYTPIEILILWGNPFLPRVTFFDMHARILIGLFVGKDVLEGIFTLGADGVGHLAHLGGAAAGYLLTLAFRAEKDSREYADAQTMVDEYAGDYTNVPLDDLALLLDKRPDDAPMLLAYCQKAANDYAGSRVGECVAALHKFARPLAEKADPVPLAQLLVGLPPNAGLLPGMVLMRVAAKLEQKTPGLAAPLYRRVYDQAPDTTDAEAALMRLAAMAERAGDAAGAVPYYHEILRRFPNGAHALHATNALQRLGQPVVGYSAGSRTPTPPTGRR
jgi:membrane associated rhomboid family serine protease